METNVPHLSNYQYERLIISRGFCSICGMSKTHPNYAYHVCVPDLYKNSAPLDTHPDPALLYLHDKII